MVESEYVDAGYLQTLTGTKASTWRYWAYIGEGPSSFKLGRRRVWRKSEALEWISAQQGIVAVEGCEL